MLVYYLLMWLWPAHTIDIAPDFVLEEYYAAAGEKPAGTGGAGCEVARRPSSRHSYK